MLEKALVHELLAEGVPPLPLPSSLNILRDTLPGRLPGGGSVTSLLLPRRRATSTTYDNDIHNVTKWKTKWL